MSVVRGPSHRTIFGAVRYAQHPKRSGTVSRSLTLTVVRYSRFSTFAGFSASPIQADLRGFGHRIQALCPIESGGGEYLNRSIALSANET